MLAVTKNVAETKMRPHFRVNAQILTRANTALPDRSQQFFNLDYIIK